MGDELRVTVIATGISKKEESDTISELDAVGRSSRKGGAKPQPEPEKILQEPEHRAVSFARPNPVPKGIRPMPTPVFDDQNDLAEWDEPAYIRKKAN
jgi:hypothetical protein